MTKMDEKKDKTKQLLSEKKTREALELANNDVDLLFEIGCVISSFQPNECESAEPHLL